jgi:hypothetical protein
MRIDTVPLTTAGDMIAPGEAAFTEGVAVASFPADAFPGFAPGDFPACFRSARDALTSAFFAKFIP